MKTFRWELKPVDKGEIGMKCWKCSQEVPEGAKYCGKCGARLDDQKSGCQNSDARSCHEQGSVTQESLNTGLKTEQLHAPRQTMDKQKRRIPGIVLLAVLLCAAASGSVLFGIRYLNKNAKIPTADELSERVTGEYGGDDLDNLTYPQQMFPEENSGEAPTEETAAETHPTETTPPENEPIEPEIIQVSAGGWGSYALWNDGTVTATGRRDGNARYDWDQFDVASWKDIVYISAGDTHVVGIRKDGTAVAIGENTAGQCNISGWRDLQSVSAGTYTTVGLKKDGTVVAVGDSSVADRNTIANWTNVVQVCAGETYTTALKSDGTVVAAGNISQADLAALKQWRDIVQIATGVNYTVGLKKDGTVELIGTIYRQGDSVSGWSNVAAISAGDYFVVGLCKNGTVLAAGEDTYGQCSGTSSWRNVNTISARWGHVIAMQEDGELIATGWNQYDQFDLYVLQKRGSAGGSEQAKTDPPKATESKSDPEKSYLAVYQPILEKTIDASDTYEKGKGFLYDVDGDGIEELIVLNCYKGTSEYVYSVYGVQNGNLVVKCDKECLFFIAGGPTGYVEVANYRGNKAFVAYLTNVEMAGNSALYDYYYDIYDAENFEVVASTYLRTEYNYDTKTTTTEKCSVNKMQCSYADYLEVINALEPITGTAVYMSGYAWETGVPLTELLEYIRQVAG